jgi:hypothetical protein
MRAYTGVGERAVQQLSSVQDYILNAVLHHRVVQAMGQGDTVVAGFDFTRDVSVLSNEHDVLRDLMDSLEDWLLLRLRRNEQVPIVQGIDLNSGIGKSLIAWHESHGKDMAPDPDQAWFWSEEWQQGEQEASADIETGRVTQSLSDDELRLSFPR